MTPDYAAEARKLALELHPEIHSGWPGDHSPLGCGVCASYHLILPLLERLCGEAKRAGYADGIGEPVDIAAIQEIRHQKAVAQVAYDMHDSLGVRWGDDPYERIKALLSAEAQLSEARAEVQRLKTQLQPAVDALEKYGALQTRTEKAEAALEQARTEHTIELRKVHDEAWERGKEEGAREVLLTLRDKCQGFADYATAAQGDGLVFIANRIRRSAEAYIDVIGHIDQAIRALAVEPEVKS